MISNSETDKHVRRAIRLSGFDYGQPGAYFVTICAHRRAFLFGEIVNDEMQLNANGRVIHDVWMDLPRHYPHVEPDAFVVMPNHFHGILLFVGSGVLRGSTHRVQPLPEIVRGFKTFSARRVNGLRSTPGRPVWQRNFYDHVIRDEGGLNRVRQYIAENPARWAEDPENPTRRTESRGRD